MTAPPSIDPGALLARTYPVPGGPRVRLRLLRSADAPAVRELLHRAAMVTDEVWLQRLSRYDPRRRIAIVAVAPRERGEALLGVGSIEFDGQDEPELVVIDPACGEELELLLTTALRARARRAA